jgi:hypothetical protein
VKLELVQTSQIGFGKGLLPMDQSVGESEQKIKKALEGVVKNGQKQQGNRKVLNFELVPMMVSWV